MAPDESFKRPGSIPFKWEVQPGVPKQQPADDCGAPLLPPATPRLAPPPAARASKLASASCRRSTSAASAPALLSSPPPTPTTPSSHRRSMSARFATSLVLPFTRRHPRRGRSRDDADADFCVLHGDKIA